MIRRMPTKLRNVVKTAQAQALKEKLKAIRYVPKARKT